MEGSWEMTVFLSSGAVPHAVCVLVAGKRRKWKTSLPPSPGMEAGALHTPEHMLSR